ncbi:FAD-dependent oxidoreductase domain-containing protein 2-like [Saccostrea echinata]|uniref:FAD-dependent oxidoreductase domain-containing protein 2-like n=1 Tax=Saccostrea echinata TaxID=191078 RepID=UPI002A8157FD|nr:FAD-dependent oxidoreductase domain-containing protein 2-like [Saccostrea echinata]
MESTMQPSDSFVIGVVLLCLCWTVSAAPTYHDYCVIGAGPAGLQIGYFLQRSQRNYVIFEKSNSGGSFFTKYPIHRKLISINKIYTGKINKEYNLRHDWNSLLSDDDRMLFKHFSRQMFPSADVMVTYLQSFADHFNLTIHYNTEISDIHSVYGDNTTKISMKDQHDNQYVCRIAIVATGIWQPRIPDIPGQELMDGYESLSLNASDYEGKSVMILGRGNSAFETATAIYDKTNFVHMVGRHRIRLAWETHYVGDLRAVNNELLDTYQLKSLDGLLEYDINDYKVVKEGEKLYLRENHALGQQWTEYDNDPLLTPYDMIIRCLGFKFDPSIFRKISDVAARPSQKYPVIDYDYRSSVVDGIYFTGAIAHSLDFRQSAGGFIHGFRYSARILSKILNWRYHQEIWPSEILPVYNLSSAIIKRVNEASGLYQMFTYLGDVVLVDKDGMCEYVEEYPVKLIHKFGEVTGIKTANRMVLVVVLQYGEGFHGPEEDVFRVDRAATDPEFADYSNFLHPVIHYFSEVPKEEDIKRRKRGQPLPPAERIHHVLEDFSANWDRPHAHIKPLNKFLQRILKTSNKCRSPTNSFSKYLALTEPLNTQSCVVS